MASGVLSVHWGGVAFHAKESGFEKAPGQLQSHFGPFGPELPEESKKRVKKESPRALWSQGPEKVLKESEKSQKRVKNDPFDSFLTLFGLFRDFLDPWDRRARETLS